MSDGTPTQSRYSGWRSTLNIVNPVEFSIEARKSRLTVWWSSHRILLPEAGNKISLGVQSFGTMNLEVGAKFTGTKEYFAARNMDLAMCRLIILQFWANRSSWVSRSQFIAWRKSCECHHNHWNGTALAKQTQDKDTFWNAMTCRQIECRRRKGASEHLNATRWHEAAHEKRTKTRCA